MKQYVTFGQIHSHVIKGTLFNHNCVATFDAADYESGREKAFELFGPRFCFHYSEEDFDHSSMKYFPDGLVEVPK